MKKKKPKIETPWPEEFKKYVYDLNKIVSSFSALNVILMIH